MIKANPIFAKSALVVPAAGNSARMGNDKAMMLLPSGKTMLWTILQLYHDAGIEKLVVTLRPGIACGFPGLIQQTGWNPEIVEANADGLGTRFQSIRAGIEACAGAERIFIHNVDNPFVFPFLLKRMILQAQPGAYVVPVFKGQGGHPVLIESEIIKAVLAVGDIDTDFRQLLHGFQRITCPCSKAEILANINDAEEWKKWI